MLTELKTIVTSRIKACELLYLMHNIKPVVRQGFYPNELEKVEAFCKTNNLCIVKAPYKISLEEDNGFSNKGKIIGGENKENKRGMSIVYISKDREKALLTCLAETQQDHITTGLMLGYPKCCTEFFTSEFAKGNLNPIHKPTNVWTNLTQRDKDAAFVSHFPCNSGCKESIALAKENFRLLEKIDKKTVEEMKGVLENKLSYQTTDEKLDHNQQDA